MTDAQCQFTNVSWPMTVEQYLPGLVLSTNDPAQVAPHPDTSWPASGAGGNLKADLNKKKKTFKQDK